MQLLSKSNPWWGLLATILASMLLVQPLWAAPNNPRSDPASYEFSESDPFAIRDPQHWVNPDNMTWEDWRAPPGTNWSGPASKGSNYLPFAITLPAYSTIFTNPQPSGAELNLTRDDVPAFYRNFLNTPGKLNRGHTLHEYWMGDSGGRCGVDLTAFGAYRLPAKSYQYGFSNDMNPGECVVGAICNLNIRNDALGAWREDVGNETASSYELEFGEMKFQTKEDVTGDFGPPGNGTLRNYAKTRYVEWSSWAAASTIWPNAGGGSSTQAESSGMGTYAHELSHLLNIGDNYNNPYGIPLRRDYTGPWSMMSRGSFNGPGGPHTRWQIPPQQGGSMGSLHTLHDKAQPGLVSNESILHLSREALPDSGLVVARLTARSVSPGKKELMGIQIAMNADNSPLCNITTDVYCDGGGYNAYDVKVIDRMGADSFTPDSGVMISKTKDEGRGTYQWTIDANPQDINLLDFHRPVGTPVKITLGDYRQLADALFHAGTRSGSEYGYIDKANNLHFYIIDAHWDKAGIPSYTAAVRSLNSTSDPHKHKASVSLGRVKSGRNTPTQKGVTCSFQLKNTGTYSAAGGKAPHPQDVSSYLKSDVYRLEARVEGRGWKIELPNALVTAQFGTSVTVQVAVAAEASASLLAVVKLTATSESDHSVAATGICVLNKYVNL